MAQINSSWKKKRGKIWWHRGANFTETETVTPWDQFFRDGNGDTVGPIFQRQKRPLFVNCTYTRTAKQLLLLFLQWIPHRRSLWARLGHNRWAPHHRSRVEEEHTTQTFYQSFFQDFINTCRFQKIVCMSIIACWNGLTNDLLLPRNLPLVWRSQKNNRVRWRRFFMKEKCKKSNYFLQLWDSISQSLIWNNGTYMLVLEQTFLWKNHPKCRRTRFCKVACVHSDLFGTFVKRYVNMTSY
jgi:RNAse (barnase) inhibitor barstar